MITFIGANVSEPLPIVITNDFSLYLDIYLVCCHHMYSICSHKTSLVKAHRSQQIRLFARFSVKVGQRVSKFAMERGHFPLTK